MTKDTPGAGSHRFGGGFCCRAALPRVWRRTTRYGVREMICHACRSVAMRASSRRSSGIPNAKRSVLSRSAPLTPRGVQ